MNTGPKRIKKNCSSYVVAPHRANYSCISGYSLFEVMIGMTILGIVMASAIISLPECQQLAYRTDKVTNAYLTLNQNMEMLRTRTFAQLAGEIPDSAASSAGSATSSVGVSESSVTIDGSVYTVREEFSYVDSAQSTIQATVDVFWAQSSKTQSISSLTYLSQNGLSDKKFSGAN